MSIDLVRERLRPRAASRRSLRPLAVSALGPLTVLAGLIWAIAQPYRITLLEPQAHGFWSLVVEPPLLVVLVGVFFHLVVAPGLLEDVEEENGE